MGNTLLLYSIFENIGLGVTLFAGCIFGVNNVLENKSTLNLAKKLGGLALCYLSYMAIVFATLCY